MPKEYFYPPHKRASVLVICLWAIMILSILGIGLTSLVFQEIKFARTYRRQVISLPMARSALRAVFYLREKDPTPSYDTAAELAEENRLEFCSGNYAAYYFVDKVNSEAEDKVIDEGALINLNSASTDILKRLPGIDEELADNIANSGVRPFRSINEVLLVEGMTKETFLLFKDLVTVYGTGRININTASKEVLLALGLDEELAEVIIRFRREHIIEPPEDSLPEGSLPEDPLELEPEYGISDLNNLLADLRSFAFLGLRQEQDILSLLPVFSVSSEYLRFNIIPGFGGDKGVHYSIVIHPGTRKIISWNET